MKGYFYIFIYGALLLSSCRVVYKPKSIADAVQYMQKNMTPPVKEDLRQKTEFAALTCSYTRSAELWMERNWLERHRAPALVSDFEKHGVKYSREMSIIIMRSVYRSVNNIPMDIYGQTEQQRRYDSTGAALVARDETIEKNIYESIDKGDTLQIMIQGDTTQGPGRTIIIVSPVQKWKFDSTRDLCLTASVMKKVRMPGNHNFLAMKAVKMNRPGTIVFNHALNPGDTFDLGTEELRVLPWQNLSHRKREPLHNNNIISQ